MTAEYETPTNELNQVGYSSIILSLKLKYYQYFSHYSFFFLQVVLWDKIILRGENANLRLKNMRTKYYFWDDGNGLR